jgi:hypothetical protein
MKRTIYSIRRHEEKDGDKLTPEGMANAIKTGAGIKEPLLDIFHSAGYNRSRQTAEGITIGKYGVIQPQMIHHSSLLNMLDPKFPEGITDRENILDYWLETSGVMLQAGANVVAHVARNIIAYDQDGLVENITHAPNVESALIYLLEKSIDIPVLRMKDIGGSFKPGEAFRIVLDHKKKSIPSARIEFRNISKEIKPYHIFDIARYTNEV